MANEPEEESNEISKEEFFEQIGLGDLNIPELDQEKASGLQKHIYKITKFLMEDSLDEIVKHYNRVVQFESNLKGLVEKVNEGKTDEIG